MSSLLSNLENSLNFMTLIRATRRYGCALSVSVPSTLKCVISECQYTPRSNVSRWLHPQAAGTRPCQKRRQVYRYSRSQERTQMWQPSGRLTRYFGSMLILKSKIINIYIGEFHHRIVRLASVAATTKPFKFAPANREATSIHPFYDPEKTHVILEIHNSTHEATQQLQPHTKIMARYTSLRLPVWLSVRNRFYHTSAVVKAGHNKWSKVKHKKKVTDLEKSVTIHKYVTLISSAIKIGGGADPDSNIRLAGIIESAKKAGMYIKSVCANVNVPCS